MLYSIVGDDVEDSRAARLAARPAHIERLIALQNEGRLFVAGPSPKLDAADLSGGACGSVVIAEFASLADAEAWAASDPYIAAGVYAKVTVRPFIKVFPQ